MDDIATVRAGLDHSVVSPDARRSGPIVTAATKPFGVRVTHRGTSAETTEWFDSLQRRALWIAQAQDVTVELRALVRLTDHDEHGTVLGGREVIALHALAEEAREDTRQAGLRHAAFQHRIAAAELRAVWPTATLIVADLASTLSGDGTPFVEEIRDSIGAAIWTQGDCVDSTDVEDTVDRAGVCLGMALDYAGMDAVGWEPLTDAQLHEWGGVTAPWGEYYSLALPGTPPLPGVVDR